MLMFVLYILYGLLILTSIYFLLKLFFALTHFKMTQLVSAPAMLDELPSVSVCIPARNETHAMTQCLERVIASTYPKLEIIVLDDSSIDDTMVLIKAFAHAGVRFVEGSKLPKGWLGKNHALQGLLHEASGSYILYMDVDTQIEPDTIEQLVAYMMQQKASMISVLPRRRDGLRSSMLFAPLRYFWELIMHSKTAPAVASSAWMINRRELLDELGGFNNYKSTIQPEADIAAVFMKQNKYRFLISSALLGVSYEKKWSSQIETSERLLYPIVGKNIGAGILAILFMALLNAPFVVVLSGFVAGWSVIQLVAGLQLLVFIGLYGVYLSNVWHRGWWIGALLWPIIILQELIIMILSTDHYLRHTVTWKGRSIRS